MRMESKLIERSLRKTRLGETPGVSVSITVILS
jgi:hypothetical protein